MLSIYTHVMYIYIYITYVCLCIYIYIYTHICMSATLFVTLLDLCVSSLRRGHANLLCIIPILKDDSRRESMNEPMDIIQHKCSAFRES